MFEYDSFYNVLFENEDFLNVLYKFHSSNWDKMDYKEKKKVVDDFLNIYCEILKIPHIKKNNIKIKYAGVYLDSLSSILVDDGYLNGKKNQYDLLDTLFHEARHNFQYRSIVNNLSSIEWVSEENRKLWKMNSRKSPAGYSNYINVEEKGNLYYIQPLEEDAYKAGLLLAKNSFKFIKDKLGEDLKYYEYCKGQEENIMFFFSDDELYKTIREQHKKEVMEYFEKNNKFFELEKKCSDIAKPIFSKKVEDLSLYEIQSLFSSYVWPNLDIDYKVDVLKKFDKLTNKVALIDIVKSGNSGIKIDNLIYSAEYIHAIVNYIYSVQIFDMACAIAKGKLDFDEKIKDDLITNMIMVNRKRINFIEEKENMFTYAIQPFALFEAKLAYKWFEELKKIHIDVYGFNDDGYDGWLDTYNYKKIIPYVEKAYKKPFREVYKQLVSDMKENLQIALEEKEKIKTSRK